MAQNVVTLAEIGNYLKTYYNEKKTENLLFINSPLLRRLGKSTNRIEGKEFAMAALIGRGGAVSGNALVAQKKAGHTANFVQFKITPGKVFSAFTMTQLELLSSRSQRGAFGKIATAKCFATLESARKVLAASLYGLGYGDIGKTTVAIGSITTTAQTAEFPVSAIMALDVGSDFAFVPVTAATGLPNTSAASPVCTVTKINGTNVTFTAAAASGAVAVGSFICIDGGFDSSGNPNLPTGLAGWLPTIGGRTGAQWTSYISLPFYGVDRSVYPERAAGLYIEQKTGEAVKDVILDAINKAVIAGSRADTIVMNSYDYTKMVKELDKNTAYMQHINTSGAKGGTNVVAAGLSEVSYMLENAWLQYVIPDPFCPKGLAYILEMETIEFLGLSNVDAVTNDGMGDAQRGSPAVESAKEPGDEFVFMLSDYLNLVPQQTADGPGYLATVSVYGNFASRAPAHCAVIKLLA